VYHIYAASTSESTVSFEFIHSFISLLISFFSYSLTREYVLEFDTKVADDELGVGGGSGEFDLGSAVELLGLQDDDAKTQANMLQGAYMSFLLMRHLRLRDLQRTVSSSKLSNGIVCLTSCAEDIRTLKLLFLPSVLAF